MQQHAPCDIKVVVHYTKSGLHSNGKEGRPTHGTRGTYTRASRSRPNRTRHKPVVGLDQTSLKKQGLRDEEEVRKLVDLTGAFALGLRGLPMLAVREGRVRHQIGRSGRC